MFGIRFTRALAIATAWTLVMTSAAFADDLYNDLDTSIDAAVESTTVAVGTTRSVTLAVQPTGSGPNPDDDKSGCNLTGSTTLVTAVSSSATTKATVSPSSITWTSCGQTTDVTVTGVAAGSATISLSETSNTTGGTFDLAPATFSINVTSSDSTAPSNALISINDGAAWTNATATTVDISATDNVGVTGYALATSQAALPTSPSVTFAASTPYSASNLPFTLPGPDGTNSAWVRFFDAVGNYTDASDTIGLDRVAPTIQDDGVSAGTLGDNGWYKSAVSNDFSASDAGSGLDAACAAAFPKTVSTGASEGTNVTVASGACSDLAGNTNSGISSAGFDIDLVAPVIIRNTSADSCDDPGTNGWCKGTQTAGFTASDATSGVAPTGAASISFTQSSSTEGANVSISSGTRSDMAGHVATAINAGPFKVDSTDPGMTCGATPTFMLGQANASVSATVTDTTSGPLQATVSGAANTSLAAGGTVSLTGYDNAGNSTTVECPFSIASVTFGNPINAPSVMNVAKLGRVIPIKATVLVNNVAMTDGPVYLGGLGNASCTTGVTSDSVEEYAAAGSSNTGNLFRWDSIESRWMYNYDTSALKGGSCYRINVHIGGTVDGTGKASGGALAGYFLIKVTK